MLIGYPARSWCSRRQACSAASSAASSAAFAAAIPAWARRVVTLVSYSNFAIVAWMPWTVSLHPQAEAEGRPEPMAGFLSPVRRGVRAGRGGAGSRG